MSEYRQRRVMSEDHMSGNQKAHDNTQNINPLQSRLIRVRN